MAEDLEEATTEARHMILCHTTGESYLELKYSVDLSVFPWCVPC